MPKRVMTDAEVQTAFDVDEGARMLALAALVQAGMDADADGTLALAHHLAQRLQGVAGKFASRDPQDWLTELFNPQDIPAVAAHWRAVEDRRKGDSDDGQGA